MNVLYLILGVPIFPFLAAIAQPRYERAPANQALLTDDVRAISESGKCPRTVCHSSVGKREHGSDGLTGTKAW
ncbi:MAG: hypothetical protein BYD32DRAFT_402318 [Podila humilis]|nr:MAG: hypothetical protein BYD32DRAFT_402318 [Podila humilis]